MKQNIHEKLLAQQETDTNKVESAKSRMAVLCGEMKFAEDKLVKIGRFSRHNNQLTSVQREQMDDAVIKLNGTRELLEKLLEEF